MDKTRRREENFTVNTILTLEIVLSPQAFSADQYKAMLTPQVQAISSAKRESLSLAQQDAIKSVIASDPDEEDPWGDDDDECSGTPPPTTKKYLSEYEHVVRSSCSLK